MSQLPSDNNNHSQSTQLFSQQVPPPYANPMSPSVEGSNTTRTASLLQLLKFSQPVPTAPVAEIPQLPLTTPPPPRPAAVSPPPVSHQQPVHNRQLSASDLVASLLRRSATEPSNSPNFRQDQLPPEMQPSQPAAQSAPGSLNPQDLVLQLLGRPKPSQDDLPSQFASGQAMDGESTKEPYAVMNGRPSPSAMFGATRSPASDGRPTSVPPIPPPKSPPSPNVLSMPLATPSPNKGLFNNVNLFDQLAATSPRNRAPRGSTPAPGGKKSSSGLRDLKAENIPLPFSSAPSPTIGDTPNNAATESDAARDAMILEQALREEELLETDEPVGQQILQDKSASSAGGQSASAKPSLQSLGLEELTRSSVTEPATEQNTEASLAPIFKEPAEDEEDDYESASETTSTENPVVVYNFPMKPFSSITIIPSAVQRLKFPVSKISDIVRMSRSFDQLDRNLIAASHQYIVYAISKSNGRGGIRVLRQYDAKDKVLMKDSPDRTFNVAIGKGERILGTGISGAVVWAELGGDFEGPDWNNMFVFPPSEEQGQSNGVLKSRARKTSRQVDVFAIGRGKTISIIHAPTAKAYASGRRGNEVASKKYLTEHARTIDTGKASKDFAFSDDDSVIISIDKAGKLKLWDAQELINFSGNDAYNSLQQTFLPQPPMVLTSPILYFSAVAAGETYRATSVMFLDKWRPYLKCLALRYVIVGMKQNHTLQLWDLALGRPVQEINFPQESDTDALCSVVYHPMSGIIVVGNPTRNSIYFIHLSAPKYNLPAMSQAQYVRGLSAKDPNIPKPDATAILSGLREYSFAVKGQLMSLDILDATETESQGEIPPLFELYVAHSKGMTTLSVYKEDLGWDTKHSVKSSVDAVKEGICTLSALAAPPPPEPSERSIPEMKSDKSISEKVERIEVIEPPAPQVPKHAVPPVPESVATEVPPPKSEAVSPVLAAKKPELTEEKPAVVANGNAKKRRKEKSGSNAASIVASASTDQSKSVSTSSKASSTVAEAEGLGVSAAFLDREIKKIEKTVSSEFSKVMNRELESLCRSCF